MGTAIGCAPTGDPEVGSCEVEIGKACGQQGCTLRWLLENYLIGTRSIGSSAEGDDKGIRLPDREERGVGIGSECAAEGVSSGASVGGAETNNAESGSGECRVCAGGVWKHQCCCLALGVGQGSSRTTRARCDSDLIFSAVAQHDGSRTTGTTARTSRTSVYFSITGGLV